MLLSPAKTLDLSKTSIELCSTPALEREAKVLVQELQKLGKSKLKTLLGMCSYVCICVCLYVFMYYFTESCPHLLGVNDNINTLNYERYQNFYEQDVKHGILSFDGPAFKGLDINSLDKGKSSCALVHVDLSCRSFNATPRADAICPRAPKGTLWLVR